MNKLLVFLLLAICLLQGPVASAGVKPEWMRKSEEQLNQKRTNDSYVFKVFHTWDMDHGRLIEGQFKPLFDYIRDEYQADPSSMKLDSLVAGEGELTTYRVAFTDSEGTGVVLAQRVDEYLSFEDFNDQEYLWDYYQLYAVSGKNQDVMFDHYQSVESVKAIAMAMEVIPGAGQLYKGDIRKGLIIMGSEVALGASAVVFHLKSREFQKKVNAGEWPVDSWQSKAWPDAVAWIGTRFPGDAV